MNKNELIQSTGLYPNYLNYNTSIDFCKIDDFTSQTPNLIEIMSNSTIIIENDLYIDISIESKK